MKKGPEWEPDYVTVVPGVDCFIVVHMAWDRQEKDYKQRKVILRTKNTEPAMYAAVNYAHANNLEIR